MYPVRLYLHILPDAFWHDAAGSWSGLSDSARERSVLLWNANRHSWVLQQKVGISESRRVNEDVYDESDQERIGSFLSFLSVVESFLPNCRGLL